MNCAIGFDPARPILRHAPRGLRPWASIAPPAPMPHFQIRIIATQPTFGEQGRCVSRRAGEAPLARIDQHMGEAWLKRDGGNGFAMCSDMSIAVDCTQSRQSLPRFG
jgi:hypothetical protein